MKVGDLVRVKTKYYGTKLAVVVAPHGIEWVVKPFNHPRNMICFPCDLEVISASR